MLLFLSDGQYELFALLIISIVLSLSCHEFGHAYVAKLQGDRTAEAAGRLTLNPLAHVDVFGLLMVIMVGFGYAKPVPTDPRNFTSRYSTLWVAAAGPFMNLVLAFISANVLYYLLSTGNLADGPRLFLAILAQINLLLMLFNLLPIGPLDGHYILPYFLPKRVAYQYQVYNLKYGTMVLLGLIALSLLGVPIFSYLLGFASVLLSYIVFV
ncbi:MAG: site-2 protease family protein [Pseudomonadales bacterium]|nr:site-2 protease family protein [Pseudomonadales bacterium]